MMHLTGAAAFVAWTLSSLLCHWSAKTFLDLHDNETCLDVIQSAFLLTLLQVSACFLVLRFDVGDALKPALLLLSAHACASFCTNASFVYVATSQSLAVKSTEPLTTAALLSLIAWKLPSKLTSVCLSVVMIGVLGFVGGSSSFGVGSSLALTSNLLFGLRNVNKRQIGSEWKVEMRSRTEVTVNAVCVALMAAFLGQVKGSLVHYLVCTAISHVTYTYISTCVILKHVNVVEHAVANIAKRLLIVLAFALIPGHHQIHASNWFWLGVSLCGFAVYCHKKRVLGVDEMPVISNIVCKIAAIFLLAFLLLSALMLHATLDCKTRYAANQTHNVFAATIQKYQQHNEYTLSEILGQSQRVVYYNISPHASYADAMQSFGLTRALRKMDKQITARCFHLGCPPKGGDFDIIAKQTPDLHKLCTMFTNSKIVVLLEGNESASQVSGCGHRVIFVSVVANDANDAILVPGLAFSIGVMAPWMPPVYDVLLDLPNTFDCDAFKVAGLHCALSHHSNWTMASVSDHGECESVHSFGIMMHVLRARVVITDSVTSHVSALLLGIPHVLLSNGEFESEWDDEWSADAFVRAPDMTDELVRRVVQMTKGGRELAPAMQAAPALWNMQYPDF
ncbi:hypothetical protein CAPTEDRAFT_217188 [Capitella teleta]|uniref:Sugar phosphate transporter domain-containing protein n=1 Tax=Capitella teleta TaxID=283909 RepID=R7U7P0_CAPTE|nr:hypothetical protein CAPTEDRAFT_217188 [Capitella teleta]|eukprot:ELT99691.1 hypothetical protein CAPTEDRAFT_217188 [Capitella teleta]